MISLIRNFPNSTKTKLSKLQIIVRREVIQRFGLLCLILILGFTSCKLGGSQDLTPGSSPPSFSLKTLTGEEVSLENYQGKVVLINFWASWCAPCLEEIPNLNRLYKITSRDNFEILAIAVNDEVESLSKTVQNMHIQFPVLLDTKGLVSSSYKVNGFPESFMIDKAGDLTLVLDDKKREPVFRVIGPREWGLSHYLDQIKKLTNK